MKKRISESEKKWYLVSFILGALVYYMFLSYSQMAGGKYVILMSDALEGYVPYLRWFYNNLLRGNSVSYTWSSYLGINAYIGISSSLIFSISTPVYLLFNKLDYSLLTVIVLIFKSGLTSLFFFMYMRKIWKVKETNAVIFSVMYALCSFQVAYIPILMQFSDAVFMLPVILLLVSYFADDGRYRFMCGAYLYLFLNFYYTGYIVGFFSLFYLVFYMIVYRRYTIRTAIKKLLIFGICIIFTAGLTGIILYPAWYFISTKYAPDSSVMNGPLGVYLHDLYNQLFIGQTRGIVNSYPSLYCGIPTLLLFPFYFFNRKISKQDRLLWIILLTIMILSCVFTVPYLFWHCFDMPDMFAYRFAFIISFLLCVIACRESEYILDIKRGNLIILIIINSCIYMGCMYIQPLLQYKYKYYAYGTWLYLIINCIFMICYLLWVIWYDKAVHDNKNTKEAVLLAILVVCTELIVNGHSAYFKDEGSRPVNYHDSYKLWEKTTENALQQIYTDNAGFYRIDCRNDFITNGPYYFGYNGIASFSNMENYEVRRALGNVGLGTSTRVILSNGLTDFTRMLLGVAYVIDCVDFEDHAQYITDTDQHAVILKNDSYLSLGFLAEGNIKDFEFDSRNQFVNINKLATCLSGEECCIYDLYTGEIKYDEKGINVVNDDDGTTRYIYAPYDGMYGGILSLSIPKDEINDRNAFVQFDYGESLIDNSAPYVIDLYTKNPDMDEKITVSYIKPMTELDNRLYIGIYMDNVVYDNIYAPQNINFAYYNYDEFLKAYDALKDGQMEVLDYGNGWVDGHIDVNEDGKVLFTSIPYDEGWEIKVNGVKTEPLQLLDGAFIGLELPKGSYDIEFRYHVPGLKTGVIISLISLMLMIGLFIINPQIKTEVRPERIKKKDDGSENTEIQEFSNDTEVDLYLDNDKEKLER